MLKQVSTNPEISDKIINLLESSKDKANKHIPLSVAQVSQKLKIPREKARRHLFLLWKNGLITRSKHPMERALEIESLNPVTIIYYVYTLNGGSTNGTFVTYNEWLKQQGETISNCFSKPQEQKYSNPTNLEQCSPKIKVLSHNNKPLSKMGNKSQNFGHSSTWTTLTIDGKTLKGGW
ncbi:MAG: helix-turn-helix domain-containing protein [Candidatus Bathycorpusculaceae bacterium]